MHTAFRGFEDAVANREVKMADGVCYSKLWGSLSGSNYNYFVVSLVQWMGSDVPCSSCMDVTAQDPG